MVRGWCEAPGERRTLAPSLADAPHPPFGHLLPANGGEKEKNYSAAFTLFFAFTGTPISMTSKPVLSAS
jgi:hypothetical protein